MPMLGLRWEQLEETGIWSQNTWEESGEQLIRSILPIVFSIMAVVTVFCSLTADYTEKWTAEYKWIPWKHWKTTWLLWKLRWNSRLLWESKPRMMFCFIKAMCKSHKYGSYEVVLPTISLRGYYRRGEEDIRAIVHSLLPTYP